jgi:hypothetical protein
VFEKTDGKQTFTLTHYLPASDHAGESDCLAAIREKIGWDLDVAPDLTRLGLPSQDELTRLRLCDPHRFFLSAVSQLFSAYDSKHVEDLLQKKNS